MQTTQYLAIQKVIGSSTLAFFLRETLKRWQSLSEGQTASLSQQSACSLEVVGKASPTEQGNPATMPTQKASDSLSQQLPPAEATPPDDNRVRILIYGSADVVEATIAQLHQLRFIEQFRWDPIRPMPENGICIPPEHAAYSFLLKAVR